MDVIKKLINKFTHNQNLITIILGAIFVGLLIAISKGADSSLITTFAFAVAGLMNISNGSKLMKTPKNKSRGMSLLLFGVILIFMGVVLTILI